MKMMVKLFKNLNCPKCGKQLHYGFFATGKHVCNKFSVDKETLSKLQEIALQFDSEIKHILDEFCIELYRN